MRRMLPFILLILMTLQGYGQDESHNISRQEAKSLLRSLDQKNGDSLRTDHLLRLALYNILKPGSEKPDLDSAAMFIKKAESVASVLKSPAFDGYIAWVKANLYREKGQKEQGKAFARKAVELLKNTPDKYHLGSAYLEMAQYYHYDVKDEAPEKTRLVEEAVAALEPNRYIELKAYALQFLADLYDTRSEDLKALQTIKRALAAYQSIHYKRMQQAYNVCAVIYYDLSDYQNALAYELKALAVAQDLNDVGAIGPIYNMLGAIYDSTWEREKARNSYLLALQNARQRKDIPAIGFILLNIVIDYDYMNRDREALDFINKLPERDSLAKMKGYPEPFSYLLIYSGSKADRRAEPYISKLINYIRTGAPSARRISRIYARFVRYYTLSGRFKEAEYYLKKVDSIDRAIGDHFAITWDYFLKFKLDSSQGNFRAALANISKYVVFHDSLLNETKTRQLKQIQVAYETEKKENEIKLKDKDIRLLNQTNVIELANLDHARTTKNWMVVSSCMLLIIASLFYRQSLLRRRNNVVVTQKNELLQHLLTEKEWLLKEVHHRVKNNLHTVICLLESQARYLENDALKAIENSQHRIYAMSLIHQKLYQTDDIKTIDMGEYIPELVQSLEKSFAATGQIRFVVKIDPVSLDISHAIPLGLIINEAVTNSIKYAFPDGRKGEISISMGNEHDKIKLVLADNGIGMPHIDPDAEPASLGLRLMKGLSDDIDSYIRFEIDNGTRITILFEQDALNDPDRFLKLPETKEIYT